MRQTLHAKTRTIGLNQTRVVFTPAEARRALPYVARIVEDAAGAFREIQHCRAALDDSIGRALLAEMNERRERAFARLNAAIDECNAVGADLIDIPRGIVRFNACIDGRNVPLMWRMGESILDAWATLAAGANDRYAAAR